ncbi:hypothetical protein FG386_002577 [Cryptosporidium ryanae]|uniref:uncharacterized protein n=1 Tax=Cryptosporidium ryanae TaxID=515981 RepID=UPI00351A364B|nr:hypothetical protein FG386_002577 [Cryptosporidium ryanae]
MFTSQNQSYSNFGRLTLSGNHLSSINSASLQSPSYVLGPSKQSATINGWAKLNSKSGPQFTNIGSYIHRRAGRISRSPSPERSITQDEKTGQLGIKNGNVPRSTVSIIGPAYLPSKIQIESLKNNESTRSASVGISAVKNICEHFQFNEKSIFEENRELKKQISELKELLSSKEEECQKLKVRLELIQRGVLGNNNAFSGRESLPPLKVKARNVSKSIIKEYKNDAISLYVCGDHNAVDEGELCDKKCLWKPCENVARALLKQWNISYACTRGKRTNKNMVNQDDFCIQKLCNNNLLVGVFDGHGRYGHKVSAIVRQKIIRGLQNILIYKDTNCDEIFKKMIFSRERPIEVEKKNYGLNIVSEISNLFDNVQSLLEKENSFGSSGTSATIALVQAERIIMIQLGSSGGKIIDSSTGNIIYETPQHNLENYQERKRILNKGGLIDNNRFYSNKLSERGTNFSMTRSLGDINGKPLGISHKPEIWEMKVEKGDSLILILGTDGFLEHSKKIEVNYTKLYIQEELDLIVKKCQNSWLNETSNASVDDITMIACNITV